MTGPLSRSGRPMLRLWLTSAGAGALVLALASAAAAAAARAPASAMRTASRAALPTGTRPGPAAVSDAQGNTYAVWRDPHGQLWEDRHAVSARSWGAARLIAGMANLESAPAATLQANAPIATYDGLYVFWAGRGSGAHPAANDLWYAFTHPDGTWAGPFLLAPGPVTSAPAVTTDNAGTMYVFWRNAAGYLDEITCDGGTLCGAGAAQQVSVNGHPAGPMGSGPAAGISGGGVSRLGSGSLYVFWRGAGAHYLWLAYLRFARWWGPDRARDTAGHPIGPLGSGPTDGLVTGAGWIFWQNPGDKGLEETTVKIPTTGPHLGPKPGSFAPQHHVSFTDPIASAPFLTLAFRGCAQAVFWKGTNSDLWWACYQRRWHGPADLHAGPIG